MVTISPPEKEQIFYCGKCDYTCSKDKDFRRHKRTLKHKNGNNDNKKGPPYKCVVCNREYKYRSGLSRHKKNCKGAKKKPKKEDVKITNELVLQMIEKQNEFQNRIINMCKERNVTYNNKMTINVFLNEKCKNAMNLTDFIEGLNVSLEDLEYTNEHGYAKGISNIFQKHLGDMKPTERPIHCSDSKRLQFYVKDQNKWEKDEKNQKIDRTIQDITLKQIDKLKEWEKENPGYANDESKMIEWYSMVREIMGGSDDGDREKNREQIRKLIGGKVVIKDAMKT